MTVTKSPAMQSRLSRAIAGVFLSWFHMDLVCIDKCVIVHAEDESGKAESPLKTQHGHNN